MTVTDPSRGRERIIPLGCWRALVPAVRQKANRALIPKLRGWLVR